MKHAIAIIVAAATLSGCVRFGAEPPASLLTLTSVEQRAAESERNASAGEAITVSVPLVPQSLANTRIAVTDGSTRIAYVKDAVWTEPPARLFQKILSETIAAKTGKLVLDPRQFSLDPGTVLSGQMSQFGIDAQRNEAVIVYEAAVSSDRGQKVRTRRFEARAPVSAIEALPASAALNAAANRIASDVAGWIG